MPAMRVTLGGLQWVWDNNADGVCDSCEGRVVRGDEAYRLPRRPWKTRQDPIVHLRCWDQHKADVEPTMAAVRRMRSSG